MRKLHFLLFLLSILILHGCNNDESDPSISNCISDDCIPVYDGYKIVKYDLGNSSSLGYWNTKENQFQYTFNKNDEYITSGNSISNHFGIFKKVGNRYEQVYQHQSESDAIFPFAVVDGIYLFSKIDYSNNNMVLKGIYKIDSKGKLTKINTNDSEKTRNIINSISDENKIFCTLTENGVVNLYEVDVTLSTFDLVNTDVNGAYLSTLSGQPCYEKEGQFFCNREYLLNLENDSLFAAIVGNKFILEVSESGYYKVMNIHDKKTIKSGNDYIGYHETEKKITLYTEGKIEELEVE